MYGNIKGKENLNFTSYNKDPTKYNNIFIKNKKNQEANKDKTKNEFENEIKSNSGTSISSNKEGYNNFVSKIKLNYNLKNPQGRTQTIILHTSLDKSLSSDINNSLNESDNNNVEQNDSIYNNQNEDLNPINSNPIGSNYSQLNNGFMLDNSSLYNDNFNTKTSNNGNNFDPNNMKNNKRNTVNYINSVYENEKENENENEDNNIIQSEKGKKDNLTINFNNNMFFVGDNQNRKIGNNGEKNKPANNIFNDFRPESEQSFNDKIFVSHNAFDNNYPGLVKTKNDNNILLPYGFQNNSFLNPNQVNNKNNNKIYENDFINFEKDNKKNSNQFNYIPYSNNEANNMNNESTNLCSNSNNANYNPNQNNNNISPFNTVQQSVNSLPNFANSSNDLNVNNNNDGHNEKIIFYPYNNDANYNNNEENNKNPTSQFNTFPQNIPNNRVNAQNNQINTTTFDDNNNNDLNEKNNDNDFVPKDSYIQLVNNLSNIPFNNNNNFERNNNNNSNNYNDYNERIKVNNYRQEDNSLRSSLDYSNNNASITDEKSDNKNNLLRSLLYGFFLGSTVSGLFWLRNEKAKNYLWEKISKINFNSIIQLFKALLHPVEFLTKILSKEKREVYLKVLGVTLGKFYDFLEKYGDGFRLLGTFLFVYAIWLIIKSLIKASIKIWKDNN